MTLGVLLFRFFWGRESGKGTGALSSVVSFVFGGVLLARSSAQVIFPAENPGAGSPAVFLSRALLVLPLPLLEQVRCLETVATFFVACDVRLAANGACWMAIVIFRWVFNPAALAVCFVWSGADVRAMPETTAGVADFHLLLVQEASIFRTAVVYVVRNFGTFEDDNNRACLAHSSRLEDRGVLRVDQTLCDVFLRVIVGYIVNHAFRCVVRGRHIRRRSIGLALDLNFFDAAILLGIFHRWRTHDHDVLSLVEANEVVTRPLHGDCGAT